ncbi:MAG: uroporphyrinogen decarboxylase family protein [Victivallales bacterium]
MNADREIKPRERVMHAIRHEETDRVPRFVNFSSTVADRLLEELQLSDESSLKSYFQADIDLYEIPYRCPRLDGKDLFGVEYQKSPERKKNNIKFHPLANIQGEDDIVYHEWPNPDWADYTAIKRKLSDAFAEDRFTAASCGGGLVNQTFNLIGRDNFLSAIDYNPHLLNAVIWKLNEFFMEVDRRLFTCCHGILDMSYHVNDLSSLDRGLFLDFFAGPISELNRQAKSFGLKTMLYTPGAVGGLIPELIECGYDVIAPLQYSAKANSAEALKDGFGDQIAFMGHVCTDKVLAIKSADEIHGHVSGICEAMKHNGGFIIGPDDLIEDNIPTENILALYEAADIYGNYEQ